MLDLTTANATAPYELKLFDGTLLTLKRPTQALQETLLGLSKLEDNINENDAIKIFINLFVRILNRNEQGLTYTVEEVSEEYDMGIAALVVKDYFTYWNQEVSNLINFHHTQQ